MLRFMLILLSLFCFNAFSHQPKTQVLLPLNCQELLPDYQPYRSFLKGVATVRAHYEYSLSKRLFRVLHFRKMIHPHVSSSHPNPIDVLIKKTLCFYREQVDPVSQVSVQDKKFLNYIRWGSVELEKKTIAAIEEIEKLYLSQKKYDRLFHKNQGVATKARRSAEKEASFTHSQLKNSAKRQVDSNPGFIH